MQHHRCEPSGAMTWRIASAELCATVRHLVYSSRRAMHYTFRLNALPTGGGVHAAACSVNICMQLLTAYPDLRILCVSRRVQPCLRFFITSSSWHTCTAGRILNNYASRYTSTGTLYGLCCIIQILSLMGWTFLGRGIQFQRSAVPPAPA